MVKMMGRGYDSGIIRVDSVEFGHRMVIRHVQSVFGTWMHVISYQSIERQKRCVLLLISYND